MHMAILVFVTTLAFTLALPWIVSLFRPIDLTFSGKSNTTNVIIRSGQLLITRFSTQAEDESYQQWVYAYWPVPSVVLLVAGGMLCHAVLRRRSDAQRGFAVIAKSAGFPSHPAN